MLARLALKGASVPRSAAHRCPPCRTETSAKRAASSRSISRPRSGRAAAVAERGLRNVTQSHGDAQVFDFEPAAFDLATSRMGVMFFADPAAAFRNIGGALRPSGRLVFACWAPIAENRHWLISYDIALRQLGPPAPPPAHQPGPLAFGDPDYIRGFLAAAGFAEITVDRAHPTIIGGSPEEEARQALLMGPTARLIEAKNPDDATRQTIAREIEAAFAAEASAGPIRLPATIFLVAARRPRKRVRRAAKLRWSRGSQTRN